MIMKVTKNLGRWSLLSARDGCIATTVAVAALRSGQHGAIDAQRDGGELGPITLEAPDEQGGEMLCQRGRCARTGAGRAHRRRSHSRLT